MRWFSPLSTYLLVTGGVTAFLCASLIIGLRIELVNSLSFAPALALLLLANDLASRIVRGRLLPLVVPARTLPSMAARVASAERFPTAICVPTLLLNIQQINGVVSTVERNYCAARDPRVLAVLLVDFVDSASQSPSEDDLDLLRHTVSQLSALNARYGSSPFFAFIRDREYSNTQDRWIGRERKRGKIEAFFELVCTGSSELRAVLGEPERVRHLRYALVIDDDNQITTGALQKLIGTMVHPLNAAKQRPGMAPDRGHAVIVPHLEDMSAFKRKRLLHTRCVDLDVFGQRTYPGKGICDIAFWREQLKGRVPAEKILSHDTFEGIWLRPGHDGRATIQESIPSSYIKLSDRLHRWIRGDWQNFFAFASIAACGTRVPPFGWLTLASQLRESALPLASTLLILSSTVGGHADAWIVAWLYLYFGPFFGGLLIDIVLCISHDFKTFAWRRVLRQQRLQLVRLFLTIGTAPHRAALALDAIARATWRTLRGRRLLEWQSARATELSSSSWKLIHLYLWLAPLTAAFLILYQTVLTPSAVMTMLCILWGISPWPLARVEAVLDEPG
jgi:cyclic beta-1,2-glucan synthetase